MRARWPIPIAIAALLASPLAAAWFHDGFEVERVIDSKKADPAKPFEAFDAASLNLYDFNGDGEMEIVSSNDNNRVYVLSPNGRILAEIETTHPGGDAWAARDINPVAIGDLYGDGAPCMVIPNGAGYLSAWCYRGDGLFGRSFEFERTWEIRVDASEYEPDFAAKHPWIGEGEAPGVDGNAFLAEVDGDPGLEVFVESDGYPGQFSFDSDGSYRWSTSNWDGNAGGQVADLDGAAPCDAASSPAGGCDGDGAKEAVFASDAGVVTTYDARTGKILWTFDARKAGADPGSIPVAPLLADLDGKPGLEVFFGARHAVEGPGDWRNASHAVYFALDAKGKLLWRVSESWMNPLTYNHAAALDVDGDGDTDVLTLDWNTVGHKPGNWEPTGRPSNLFALDGATGQLVWRQYANVYWSNKDFVVADVQGDAAPEIVLNEAEGSRDGLGVRDLRTGQRVAWHALPEGWEAMRGPVAGDVEGDGKVRLVVPIARPRPEPNYRPLDVGYREGALAVIDTGSSGAISFSANFHHSERVPTTGAPTPWVKVGAVLLAVAVGFGVAYARSRRA